MMNGNSIPIKIKQSILTLFKMFDEDIVDMKKLEMLSKTKVIKLCTGPAPWWNYFTAYSFEPQGRIDLQFSTAPAQTFELNIECNGPLHAYVLLLNLPKEVIHTNFNSRIDWKKVIEFLKLSWL